MKRVYIFPFIALVLILNIVSSCNKVLDKTDLTSILSNSVWKDPGLTTAFVNNLYLSLPSWDVSVADASEEASRKNQWIDGTTTIDNGGPAYWPYADIRNMNTFLANVDSSICTIDNTTKTSLKAQVRFIRAYIYFELVKRYGGVPIITKPQKLTDDLRVKRTPTKDCFNFIISELTAVADLLPDKYTSSADLGRVTKGAVLALKGRVLLFLASPQFNPSNNITKWQDAYDANKAAMDYLTTQGYGLVDKYTNNDLFLTEMNKEVVFAIRYINPGRTQNRDAGVRPIDFAANNTGACHPTQKLVDAFPLKSGKKTTWNNPVYAGNATLSWQGRDDRFYATIAYNGAKYLNTIMALNDDAQNGYAYGKQNGSLTGYYDRKAIDETLDITNCQISGTDFIDIRLAEVMMNYAEAAAELGKLSEAFDVLKTIRKRAGINETTPGDPELAGKVYGLDPDMNQPQMRQALRDERFIEFAFEQKRFWDLRRWKIMDQVMTGQNKRYALVLHTDVGKPGNYTYTLIDKDATPMIYNQNMYFLPMSTATIQGNPNIEQTKGWGTGTFDPVAGM